MARFLAVLLVAIVLLYGGTQWYFSRVAASHGLMLGGCNGSYEGFATVQKRTCRMMWPLGMETQLKVYSRSAEPGKLMLSEIVIEREYLPFDLFKIKEIYRPKFEI